MEKRTPHSKLEKVKALIEADQVRATASAQANARALGVSGLSGMCEVIMAMTNANFYKSMTTHCDHKIWQDVYHTTISTGVAVYLKLTIIDDVLIVSFKEK